METGRNTYGNQTVKLKIINGGEVTKQEFKSIPALRSYLDSKYGSNTETPDPVSGPMHVFYSIAEIKKFLADLNKPMQFSP